MPLFTLFNTQNNSHHVHLHSIKTKTLIRHLQRIPENIFRVGVGQG
jgi:hypothetical protein